MAYALMCGLPPITGLYVTFFTVLSYIFLGTSHHSSTGTYAIISLMVVASIEKYNNILFRENIQKNPNSNGSLNLNETQNFTSQTTNNLTNIVDNSILNNELLSNDPIEARIQIAMTLSLLTGLFHLLFAIFHIGYVTRYLSTSIVDGFTCG